VSPVRYKLGFYIPEDGIIHSHRRENLKFYIKVTEMVFVMIPIVTTSIVLAPLRVSVLKQSVKRNVTNAI
jgi:hypothetical protein